MHGRTNLNNINEIMKYLIIALFAILTLVSSVLSQIGPIEFAGERHLKNIKQLTFGGENAEAYFSFDGKQLIFQSKRDKLECDQIFSMNIDGSNLHMVVLLDRREYIWYVFGLTVIPINQATSGSPDPPEPKVVWQKIYCPE